MLFRSAGGGGCADPNADLTNKAYPHFGSGNCGPYFGDQTWMSANDPFVNGQYGWHDSNCPGVSANPYCAIQFPQATRVKRFRALLHTNPPKKCTFQGSNDSDNGVNGAWTTLYGPFDFVSGQEGVWSQDYSFNNANSYKLYRLNCPGSPPFALYEWEMFCGP